MGIFDMDSATVSEEGQLFLKIAEKESRVTNVSSDLPKSFIVATEAGTTRVYISGVAARVLKKRTITDMNNGYVSFYEKNWII